MHFFRYDKRSAWECRLRRSASSVMRPCRSQEDAERPGRHSHAGAFVIPEKMHAPSKSFTEESLWQFDAHVHYGLHYSQQLFRKCRALSRWSFLSVIENQS